MKEKDFTDKDIINLLSQLNLNWEKEEVPTGFLNLTVYSVPADKLLAMKLSSGRAQSKDQSDAIKLMKHLNIKTVDDAFKILEDSIPKILLTAKAEYFTIDTFGKYKKEIGKEKTLEKQEKLRKHKQKNIEKEL